MNLFFLTRYPSKYRMDYLRLYFSKVPLIKHLSGEAPKTFKRLHRHLRYIKANQSFDFELVNGEAIVKSNTADEAVKVFARETSSDFLVYRQVFLKNGYRKLVEIVEQYNINPKVVLDCGSNVGYTSIYLNLFFKNIKLICVEPDRKNNKQIHKNFELNNIKNYKVYRNALWSERKKLYLNNDFRDGSDWAISASEQKTDMEVESITIRDIIRENNIDQIDILKIDIEGAEKDIFENDKDDFNWLKITKVIAIEIHDEYDCREKIRSVLNRLNFDLFEDGELTYGINMNLCKPN